jgi:hypothetical protein
VSGAASVLGPVHGGIGVAQQALGVSVVVSDRAMPMLAVTVSVCR